MKLSICVIHEKGGSLIDWRNSIPFSDTLNIEIVALQTSVNTAVNTPRATEIGRGDNLVALSMEYPSYYDYFDFSECRNYLDSKANGDWILHLDSDERIVNTPEDFSDYIRAINETDSDAAWISIAGVSREELEEKPYAKRYNIPALRLHRKSAGLYWSGICHETLDLSEREIITADTEIHVLHSGYAIDRKEMRDKLERNGKLMVREYSRSKTDRNWSYLKETISLLNNFEKR